jgi:hypothetical protein
MRVLLLLLLLLGVQSTAFLVSYTCNITSTLINANIDNVTWDTYEIHNAETKMLYSRTYLNELFIYDNIEYHTENGERCSYTYKGYNSIIWNTRINNDRSITVVTNYYQMCSETITSEDHIPVYSETTCITKGGAIFFRSNYTCVPGAQGIPPLSDVCTNWKTDDYFMTALIGVFVISTIILRLV